MFEHYRLIVSTQAHNYDIYTARKHHQGGSQFFPHGFLVELFIGLGTL